MAGRIERQEIKMKDQERGEILETILRFHKDNLRHLSRFPDNSSDTNSLLLSLLHLGSGFSSLRVIVLILQSTLDSVF